MEKEEDSEEQESSEDEETTIDEKSIEELVEKSQPQRRFSQQPDSFTPRNVSPSLESIPSQQQPLETDFQETPVSQTPAPSGEFQPYYNNKYYSSPKGEDEYIEVTQNFSPVLEQDFSRISQSSPRMDVGDTNWAIQTPKRDWEKKYEVKNLEDKRDRRRMI